jgi:YesN/AraC family two-component response regulator
MLVDDEPFIREEFKSLVDWNKHGFNILHETYNGEEALKAYNQEPVDIIITDLKMPVMDGLTLIERVRHEVPGVHFIVLSAYDEFHLVKNAFKLGVHDYILKSEMDADQIITVLNKTREHLEREQLKTRQSDYFDMYHDVIVQQLLRDFLEGSDGDNSVIRERLEKLGWSLPGQGFYLLLVSVSEHPQGNEGRLNEMIITTVKHIGECYYLGNFNAGYMFLFPTSSTKKWNVIRDVANEFYTTLKKESESHTDCVVQGGISTLGNDYQDLNRLYEEARQALNYSFLRGNAVPVSYASIQHEVRNKTFDASEKLERFKHYLTNRDLQYLQENIENFCIHSIHFDCGQIEEIKQLFGWYHFYLSDFINNNPIFRVRHILDQVEIFVHDIQPKGDCNRYNRWLRDLVASLAQLVYGKSELMYNAVGYIYSNFHSGISLREVAHYLGVSEGYLSRKFSREMGISVVHFITQIKMEYAAEQLKHTDLKIYEISERIGYSNTEHFSRTFKKYMGKSPKRFLST